MSGRIYDWQKINPSGVMCGDCGDARLLRKGDSIHGAAFIARFVLEHATRLGCESYWLVLMDADMRLAQASPTILYSKPIRHPQRLVNKAHKQGRSLFSVMGNGSYAIVHYCTQIGVSEAAKKAAWALALGNKYSYESATQPFNGKEGAWEKISELFFHDMISFDGTGSYISFREAELMNFEGGTPVVEPRQLEG